MRSDRPWQLEVKIYPSEFCPPCDNTPSLNCCWIDEAYLRLDDASVPTALWCRVLYIQVKPLTFPLRESILVDACARSCRKFCYDAKLTEPYLVISRVSLFLFMREWWKRLGSTFLSGGHEEDVDEVASSSPAQSGMAEAHDILVVVIIPRSLVPIGCILCVRR